MTTPEHQSPAPSPATPESRDRVYRSGGGIAGGVLLLGIVGWLGIDALVRGHGRTPWLALAVLILAVPLITAFTLRPAVYADAERLRIRNPFRVIVVPWSQVEALRSSFSNEVVVKDGAKYQLWAVPVSLRGRKRAARKEARAAADASGQTRGGRAGRGFGGLSAFGPSQVETSGAGTPGGPIRSEGDRTMDELRELLTAEQTRHAKKDADEAPSGEVTVRWAYEIAGPALAGAVVLAILLAVG